MVNAPALAEIEAVRTETFAAADKLLESIDAALALLPAVRKSDVSAIDALQGILCDMLEAMSFQDITGQRLTRVATLINATGTECIAAKLPSKISLENGPALPGEGVSQLDADLILRNDD